METEKKQAYVPLIAVGNDALIPLAIYRKGGVPSLEPPEPQDSLVRPETLEDLTIKICNGECGHKFEPKPVRLEGGQIVVELSGEQTNEHGIGVYQVDLTYNETDPSYSDGKRLVHLSRKLCRVVKASDETLTAPKEVSLEVLEALKGEKGDKGDDAYDTAVNRGLVSTLEQWIELNRGVQGKSAYQHYLDTTNDDPKLSLEEWLASNKGETGDSAYQSYLKTTTDNPKLTEEQWAKQNDYLYNLLTLLNYGTRKA